MAPTKEQIKSAFNVVVAVTETIREAGSIDGGTLYAALMGHGCDYETFQKLMARVVGSGLVEKRGEVYRWVGPMLAQRSYDEQRQLNRTAENINQGVQS